MYRALLALVLIASPLAASAQSVMDGSSKRIGEDQQAKLFGALRSSLNDPFSAQVIELEMGKDGRVCGKLNAKNGYGGFTGFRVFAFDPSNGQLTQLSDLNNFDVSRPDARQKLDEAAANLSFITTSCPHLKKS
ncbi:hypothetical protein [Afipia sp. P52-10]|uniref:hypothetical protein n=1 Tax=Afipia sp. P52-10 TaxID=1429916 RepID=UPI0004BC41CB|nr:hypothetical protein [Afipia sp. P52-10]